MCHTRHMQKRQLYCPNYQKSKTGLPINKLILTTAAEDGIKIRTGDVYYLRSTISYENWGADIYVRIIRYKEHLAQLVTFSKRKVSREKPDCVFHSEIKSILFYGTETWIEQYMHQDIINGCLPFRCNITRPNKIDY